jgi:hypothetical protein
MPHNFDIMKAFLLVNPFRFDSNLQRVCPAFNDFYQHWLSGSPKAKWLERFLNEMQVFIP